MHPSQTLIERPSSTSREPRADRLALQEKQYETGVAAVGQAKGLTGAVDPALDEHSQVMAVTLPGELAVWLMRQAGKGETAIGEAHLLGIVAENLVCRLDHHALVFGRGLAARFLNAMLHDELVNLGHIGTVPTVCLVRKFGTYVRELLEGIRFLSY